MSVAEKIISKFGGVRPLARALKSPPTTVQSWKASGLIPAQRQGDVLEAAGPLGIDLTPSDFFDTSDAA